MLFFLLRFGKVPEIYQLLNLAMCDPNGKANIVAVKLVLYLCVAFLYCLILFIELAFCYKEG